MPQVAMNAPAQRARRQAQQTQYARRERATPIERDTVQDPRLVQLTRQVMESLKHPDAIPSRVIMQALAQASALGAR